MTFPFTQPRPPLFRLLAGGAAAWSLAEARPAAASPLLGNAVSNTPESPISALVNPAQAALVSDYEINVSGSAWNYSHYQMQVPGAEPLQKSGGGPSFGNAMLAFPLPGPCGAGILGVPPKIIKGDLQKEIPLYIMNQQNTVLAKGSGEFLGMLDLALGCRLGGHVALGVAACYDGFSYQAAVSTPQNDTEIVRLTGLQKSTTFILGSRLAWGAFLVSAVTELLSHGQSRQDVVAPALSGSNMGGSSDGMSFFNKLRAGVGWRGGSLGSFFLEGEYRPTGGYRESFSAAEFRKKPVDAHDTMSFHAGYKVPLGLRHSLLAGFEYLPATLGPGGRGEGSTTGFTALNGSLIYAGFESLKPRWTAGSGLEMIFGQRSAHRDEGERPKREVAEKRPGAAPTPRRDGRSAPREDGLGIVWVTRVGITYSQATFATGDDGEQPAVYAQKSFAIPLELQVKF